MKVKDLLFILTIHDTMKSLTIGCDSERYILMKDFVAGRGPSKKDVLIDSTGVFIGILAVQIFCHGFLRSKKHK